METGTQQKRNQWKETWVSKRDIGRKSQGETHKESEKIHKKRQRQRWRPKCSCCRRL